MSTKAISAILSLKDNMSKPIVKITSKTKDLEKQTKKASNAINNFGKKSVRAIDNMVKKAGQLAMVGGAATVVFAKKSVDAAKVQLENELKLATVLKERTNATKEQIDSILKLTSAQQANGVVGDEVQLAGAQQLSTFVTQTKSVEKLIPAMNNLLVQQKGLNGTTGDAVNIGNLMGKVLQGQTGALKKVGITFSKAEEQVLKFGSEEEKAAMLAKVITNNVGEMNKAMSKTDAGAIQQAKNLFGDMQEEVGKKLLPKLGQFARWFSDHFPEIQTKVLELTDKTVSAGEKIYKTLKRLKLWLEKNKTGVEILLSTIAGFYIAVKTIGAVQLAVEFLSGAFVIANGVLSLSPFGAMLITLGLVATAILLIVESLEKAKKNWEAFRKNGVTTGEFKDRNEEGHNVKAYKTPDTSSYYKPKKKGRNALGTSYWKGGITSINEQGGEIIDLPNGSRVTPADKSKKMMESKGVTIGSIIINAKGVTADEVVSEVVPKLKLALANM